MLKSDARANHLIAENIEHRQTNYLIMREIDFSAQR